MPIRSNSPAFTTSGERRASRKKSFFFSSAGRSQPNVAALATIWRVLSSNATKMPASLTLLRAIDQRLKRKDGLSAARSTHHQRRAPAGRPPSGDFVESLDAGEHLGDRGLLRVAASFRRSLFQAMKRMATTRRRYSSRVEPGLQPGVRIGRLGFVRARRHRGIVPDHRPLERVAHAWFIERLGQVGEDAGAQACRGGHGA